MVSRGNHHERVAMHEFKHGNIFEKWLAILSVKISITFASLMMLIGDPLSKMGTKE